MDKILRDNFKSDEEYQFALWCACCYKLGLIRKWKYEDCSYPLSNKVTHTATNPKGKMVEKHLFHPHVYTPDFRIWENPKFSKLNHKLLVRRPWDYGADVSEEYPYVIDVKGSFQANDGARSFSINQKWVYNSHSVIVNKVVPQKLFQSTFVPDEIAFKQDGGRRKPFAKCKLFSEINAKKI